ncbi:MAG: hypothetical protein U1E36_02775 [Rickettsiales bacterium]
MTDAYEHMGQYFLNLWQQQVTRMSHDPQFLQSMLDMMNRMQQSSPNATQYAPAHTTATASQPAHGADTDLVRRIAELERRVAFLERGYAALSGSPYLDDGVSPKPRKNT